MKKVNLEEWKLFSARRNSTNYFNEDETLMLKMPGPDLKFTRKELNKEARISKEILSMGILVPAVYGVVKDDKGELGVIYQNIKDKVSISRALSQDISQMDKLACLFATYLKKLHSTPCTSKYFKPFTKIIKKPYKNTTIFTKEQRAMFDKLMKITPETGTCIHGDCNPGNFIVAHDIVYAIDLSFFEIGNPLYEIGALYMFMCKMPRDVITKMFHVEPEVTAKFWDTFLPYYLDTSDQKVIDDFNAKVESYGFIGMLRHATHLKNPREYLDILAADFDKAFEWVKKA